MKLKNIFIISLVFSITLFSQNEPISEWEFMPSKISNGVLKDNYGRNNANLIGKLKTNKTEDIQIIKLDGSKNSFLVTDNIDEATIPQKEFTVYGIIYNQTEQDYSGIIGAFQDNGGYEKGWIFSLEKNKLSFGLSTMGVDDGDGMMTYLRTRNTIVSSEWNFVAATYDGLIMKLFINGELSGVAESQNGNINYPENAFFELASYHDKNENYKIHGSIYKVGLYEKAMSDYDIKSLYKENEQIMKNLPIINDQSIFVVKPYMQHTTKNSVTIKLESKRSVKITISYGEELPFNEEIKIENLEEFHSVELKSLKEATIYFYQVTLEDEKGETYHSDLRTFQTAVGNNAPITFGVISDTQNNPEVIKKVSKRLYAERPNFVVHAGDIVGNGHKKYEWTDEFLSSAYELMSRVPLYASLGNHNEDAKYYYQYLSNGKEDYYYTFNYGNAQFFMIDSDRDLTVGSEHYEKVENDLSKSKSEWKIAVFHHPPYSSDLNDYGDTKRGKSTYGDRSLQDLVKLFEKYNLDIVINGHIHSYERTFPLREEKINLENGITYIVMGGAGGGLEEFAPTKTWFSSRILSDHHY